MSVGVEQVLEVFVSDKVNNLERNVHGQLSAVAAIEGSHPLLLVDGPSTVEIASIGTVVHLHALLHSWGRRDGGWGWGEREGGREREGEREGGGRERGREEGGREGGREGMWGWGEREGGREREREEREGEGRERGRRERGGEGDREVNDIVSQTKQKQRN